MPHQTEITVVSGLPRSGTSLMMQMLAQGGLPLLVDDVRTADEDNPRGYFELDRVKRTRQDASWIPAARGKVVKVVSQLLYDLPDSESYRIVFMQRSLAEVVASQERMLIRRGQPVPPPEAIASAFATHLDMLFDWLSRQSHMRFLEVHYNELLSAPDRHIDRVVAFLDRSLDKQAMQSAIDRMLYRNRDGGA
ncbi:MAG: sulfotransferase domain-containing protein [Planctomycetaceae bacterium]